MKTNYSSVPSTEVSRILTAAVINSHFRQMLLSNPGKAIETGYAGEKFNLGGDEKRKLTAIRASTLADFACQLGRMPAAYAGD
jgi:hypothetical protein